MDSGYNTQTCGSSIMDTAAAQNSCRENDVNINMFQNKSQLLRTKVGVKLWYDTEVTGFPPEASVPYFTQFQEAWGERLSDDYRDCVNVASFQVLCWKQGVSAGQTSCKINVFYDEGISSFRGNWGTCMRGSCEARHGFWSIVVCLLFLLFLLLFLFENF